MAVDGPRCHGKAHAGTLPKAVGEYRPDRGHAAHVVERIDETRLGRQYRIERSEIVGPQRLHDGHVTLEGRMEIDALPGNAHRPGSLSMRRVMAKYSR